MSSAQAARLYFGESKMLQLNRTLNRNNGLRVLTIVENDIRKIFVHFKYIHRTCDLELDENHSSLIKAVRNEMAHMLILSLIEKSAQF